MADTVTLKTQQKILGERIKMTVSQSTLVHNLRATKARSRFIQEANLNCKIYKFLPNDYLELVEDGKTYQFPKKFEFYKELKDQLEERKLREEKQAIER